METFEKRDIRREGIRRRVALSCADRLLLDTRIRKNAASLLLSRGANLVMSYVTMGTEPSLRPLERLCPDVAFCYPRCVDEKDMIALLPGPGGWGKDIYGIEAPLPEEAILVDPDRIDLVFVPCTAFDISGGRVGMGKGYYDRFLAGCPSAYRVLTAYSCQRFDRVPREECDIPMDVLVT
ncbi:MAG: 5-formyltetrahydrofolate cyclo-ligase [Clostridia bacterium]|nr:5-formyltetrahydrofolate cyclo-ligase [Clostridia bacterium]